ncbi:MAG: ABC transporter ATP-binding protein [Lachnospiraceae bacterium]|nr:ABC transporter ATP-binding protein [Lachnospiraceae bacterium]
MKKGTSETTFHWLLSRTRKQQWSVWCLLLVQLLLAGGALLQTWLLRGLIDAAVAKDKALFVRTAVYFVGIILAQLALRAALRFLREYAHASVENALKARLFGVLLNRSYADVSAVHSGEWMNRLTNDTTVVATGLSDIIPDVSGMVVRLVGALVLILVMIPQVAWVLVPGGLLLALFTFLFRKQLKLLHKKIQEADGRLRIFLTDRLTSMLVVRSFGREEASMEQGEALMAEHKGARMRRSNFSNLCNVGFGMFIQGAYGAAAIYCGYGILTGNLSYGTFVATLQLVNQVQSPFANISGYLPKYYAMLASAERLREAELFALDCVGPKKSAMEVAALYDCQLKELVLNDVAFSYPVREGETGRQTLEHVNFSVEKGKIAAVTGPSGCGKSTLLKLLMCLYPLDAGERVMKCVRGDSNGSRLELLALTSAWRGLFAYVPQGNQLMSGSIREVVSFGDLAYSDEDIWQAIDVACAEYVHELPDGLETMIGERGAGLSEGQLQRLAIARAICSGHPILLLDEATSSLDEATEHRLLQNLQTMTDRTVVIVTHRLGVLDICQKEIRMSEEGIEVRELGAEAQG